MSTIHNHDVNVLLLKKLVKDGVLIIPYNELKAKHMSTLLKYEEYLELIISTSQMQPIIEAREAVQSIIRERTKPNVQ